MQNIQINKLMKNAIFYSEIASHDKESPVGAILTLLDYEIVSMGTNRYPMWFDISKKIDKDLKGKLITHAEIDCLNSLDYDYYNSSLYMFITNHPCVMCARYITNSKLKIKKIYYIYKELSDEFIERYQINESKKIFLNHGIDLISINMEN